MHSMRNGILSVVMVLTLAVQFAQSRNQTVSTPGDHGSAGTVNDQVRESGSGAGDRSDLRNDETFRWGIGVQSGVKFHRPEAFNDFVTDVWNSFFIEKMKTPIDEKNVGPGLLLALNGTLDIGSFFHAVPFAQGMWAGKRFQIRGGLEENLHVNALTAMGGLNLWVRFFRSQRFTPRLGAGGFGAYTIAYIDAGDSKSRISGPGGGIKGLAGAELRINENFVLTLDCAVPWGWTKLKYRIDELELSGPAISYPDTFEFLGFEISPGIVFYF